MDINTRAAIQEIIDENKASAPTVSVRIGVQLADGRVGETSEATAQGVIALLNKGVRIDEGGDLGDIGIESAISTAGSFSPAAIRVLAKNLINHLDKIYPGVKQKIAFDLIAKGLVEGMGAAEGDVESD